MGVDIKLFSDNVLTEKETLDDTKIKAYQQVDPIDRIPEIKYDKSKLSLWLNEQRQAMLIDREQWLQRQRKYISQWDDYITYTRMGPWDNSSNIHLPISMEKIKAIHARFKSAIFAVRPWWMLVPIEKLDIKRIQAIDIVMRWACENYVNHNKGIESVIDDWIWDFVSVGWGVVKRRWEVCQRKAILVKPLTDEEKAMNLEKIQELAFIRSKKKLPTEPQQEKIAKEVEELITYFDGPVIETIPHEDILFPGAFQDVSDLNQPPLVCHDFEIDASTLLLRKKQGLYDSAAVEAIINKNSADRVPDNANVAEVKRAQDDYQGVQTVDTNLKLENRRMSECFFRYDINDDGLEEEMVAAFHVNSMEIARLTYLDRISMSGKRPLHKADFIRRPRRSYSIGLLEMLYPLNEEIDAIHNMRIDFGTLSNVPFFFYRSASGVKGERFKIQPGVGFPVDDPNNDIVFPRIGGGTNFGAQEEANIDRWADRITSINVMNSGIPGPAVGASRTASGMARLLDEANVNIDVMLGRFKSAYAGMLKGLLGDLQERLPEGMDFRITGITGQPQMNEDGSVAFGKTSRQEIAGKLDFILLANSSNMNRELEKQDAMQRLQMLMNPLNLQTGIVTPMNIYKAYLNFFNKCGVLDASEFLTRPDSSPTPMTLEQEFACIIQGIVPTIVLNDNHDGKILALQMMAQEPIFLANIAKGVNSPNSMKCLSTAIDMHQKMQDAINTQAQMQNQTGLQISPSLGARMSGATGETGRPIAQENVARGQSPESQTAKELGTPNSNE